jgi:uncharacterized protein YlxP (DUF503 family)
MTLGTVDITLNLPGCRSLKEKRSRLKRLTAEIRREFNVSVAETDKNDLHQTACLGIAVVANDRAYANAVLSKVVERIERQPEVYLQDYRLSVV